MNGNNVYNASILGLIKTCVILQKLGIIDVKLFSIEISAYEFIN